MEPISIQSYTIQCSPQKCSEKGADSTWLGGWLSWLTLQWPWHDMEWGIKGC